ncbi:hypothetical protein C8R44DRAFT_794364 [Mycena epipterygia]|nr:hypothetical protein C8R44DRAFT_794364 [Mycena epipterygia]
MDSASIASRHPSAENSLYTTTSSSTQWGPGALAGKAILAMGKAVVRSAEHLIILRRMSAIKAATPCSDDSSAQFGSLETMFDDLLELSRPMLYPEAIRIQAMQIIMAQIAGKQTLHLRDSISRWEIEHDELVAFLSEIVGVALFSKRGFPDKRLVHAYRAALSDDWDPWSPCITFLTGVAQLNENMFHGVLSARFLEMVLWASGAQMRWKKYNKILETNCNAAFNILSEPPTANLSILWVEQLHGFGSEDSSTSLSGLVELVTLRQMWPTIERRLLEMHVCAMLEVLLSPTSYVEVLLDLGPPFLYSNSQLELGSPTSPFSKKILFPFTSVMLNFLRYVGIGGAAHTETTAYFSRLSYRKQVATLACLIRHIISQSCIDQSAFGSSMALFRTDSPDIASTIVQFLVNISGSLQSSVLDAAIFSILPMLTTPWNSSKIFQELYRRTYFRLGRKSRSPYRGHTVELLTEIKHSGLSGVVNQANWTGNWVHFLQPLFLISEQ